jgi:lanthionine synthetase-like protein
MLYEPRAHEPLVDAAWHDARARDAIQEIATEAANALGPDGYWPQHAKDVEPDWPAGRLTVYEGAAGVLWALGSLAATGAAEVPLDLAAAARSTLERYGAEPDYGKPHAALWTGESGIVLVAHGFDPDPQLVERLLHLVRENATSPTNELMWGAPGTMLAARAMYLRTGDERFAEAWAEGAARLLAEWPPDGFWVQDLYGTIRRFIGPAHGFAGIVRALLQGDAGDPERVAAALEASVRREDGLANWPPLAGEPLDPRGQGIRTQWCHGAPGIVASLWDVAPEELLLAGGELTWEAGPLVKGPGLCHGTAGNGYAFLKLFAVTADERWLDRARRFAMHALAQVDREREEHGTGRFTLFTGDVGVALYARSCLEGSSEFPAVDAW